MLKSLGCIVDCA